MHSGNIIPRTDLPCDAGAEGRGVGEGGSEHSCTGAAERRISAGAAGQADRRLRGGHRPRLKLRLGGGCGSGEVGHEVRVSRAGHFFKWGACRGGGWEQPPGREWGETGEKRPAVSDPCRGSDLGLTSHLSKQSNNQIYPGVVTARGQRHLREAYSRSVALPRRERNGHHKDRQVG